MANYWEEKQREKEKRLYGNTSKNYYSGNRSQSKNIHNANANEETKTYEKWRRTSNALLREYDDYSLSGNYMTQEKHDDYYKRIKKQLGQAVSMRQKYGDNVEEINAIVEKLSNQVQDNYEGRKYYSQWDDDETYQQFLKYQKENEKTQKAVDVPENSEDYAELSKYKEPEGLKKFFRDDDYEFINDTTWSPKYSVNGNGDVTEQERKGYNYITDEERSKYNYIYNKLGKEQATEYLEGLNLTERMADTVIAENQEYAKEHPVLASAESVVKNVAAGGMGFAEGAWNTVTGKGIDENSYTNLINRSSNAIRETVAEGIDSKTGSFLYQTGMSMADSVAAIAATAWTGPFGLAPGTAAGFVLGSNAATNAMLSAKERGVSDGKALATGIAQGAAEMFFEKFSIGELSALKDVPVSSLKNVIGNILKQAGVEGSEEVFTSMANALTDLVINGELSENMVNVQNYIDQGYSEIDAHKMAGMDYLKGLFTDFLGGAISGGVMSSGAQMLGYATRNKNSEGTENVAQTTEEEGTETEIVEPETKNVDPETQIKDETIQPTMEGTTEETDVEEIPWEEAEMYSGEIPQNISEDNHKVAPAQPISNAAVEQSIQTNVPAQKKAQQTKDVHRESIKTVLTNGKVSDDLAAEIVRNDGLRNAMEEATGIKLEGTEQQKRNSVKYIAETFAKSNGSFVNTVNSKAEMTAPKIKAQASVNGSNVEIVGVKSVEGETAILEGADGKGYAVNKVNFNENASRKLYSDAASFAVIAGKDAANDYIRYYQPTMSLPAYEKTFNFFYNMGKNGVSVNTAMQAASEHVKMTSEEAAKKAWNLGLASRQRENAKVAVEKKQQKRKGTGSYTNETRTPNPMKEISMLMANKTGIDIVRKVELENGANAAFVPSMMQMFVSENAENEYAAILHEMGEFALSYNREGMKLTQEALINWWAQHEGIEGAEELDQIIDRYQQAYKKAEGSKTREQAMDEVLNDALAGLFSTETGTQELIEWLKTDSGYSKGEQKTIVDYLIQAIDKIINYLKQFVRENKLSKAAQTTLQMEEQRAREIRQQLLEAFDKAIENANNKGEFEADGEIKSSFAGVESLTADKSQLEIAKEMYYKGADSEEIRKTTGWHKGYDGKWRFEIDDSQMEILSTKSNYMKLDQLIKHDKLFEAYPILREISVVFQNIDSYGRFDRRFWGIDLNTELKNDDEQLRKTLIHEIQHAIQQEEGFANGANIEYWNGRLEKGFDGRTKDIKRREWELRKRYQDLQKTDPRFVEEMEELKKMTPDVPRGEIDWDTLEQIEDDPIEWQEYDKERERLEEKYGEDRVFAFIDLEYQMSKTETEGRRSGRELYYDTAGEIEARETSDRLSFDEKNRKRYQPRSKLENRERDNVVFADTKYSMSEDEGLYRYIQDAIAGKLPKKSYYQISESIPERLAKNIEEIVGFSVKDYGNEITKGRIEHIWKRHGEYGEQDKSMSDIRDIARIGYIIENYDKIQEGIGQRQFKNADGSHAKTVEIQKKIGDKYYYIIEAVPDTKRKKLQIVSAYINKKDTFSDVLVSNDPKPYVRDEHQPNVSTDIIAETRKNATEDIKNSLRVDVDETASSDNLLSSSDTYQELAGSIAERLKHQKATEITDTSIKKVTERISQKYKSFADMDSFTRDVGALFRNMAGGGVENTGNYIQLAESIIRPVLEQSKNNLKISDYAKGILKDIKSSRIKLDKLQMDEATYHYGTYNDFRKKLFGRAFLTKDGTQLDILWKEWSAKYPEWFDENISHADQPKRLAEIIDALKEDYVSEYGFTLDESVTYAAAELMQEYFNLPEVKAQFSGKSTVGTGSLETYMNDLKKEYHQKYADFTRYFTDIYKKLPQQNREQLARQQAKFNKRNAEERSKRMERQEKKKYKDSIVKSTKEITKWLEQNTDKYHVPEVLRDTTLKFLQGMDFLSEKGWNNQDTIQLQNRLNVLYRKFSSEESNAEGSSFMQDIDPDFLPTLDGVISLLENSKEVKKIADMDSMQLKEVAYLVGALKRTIATANQLIGNKRYEQVSQLGDSSIFHMGALKAKKHLGKWLGMSDEMLNSHMLDSFSFFGRMGEGAKSIHQEIRDGFNKRVWLLDEAKKYMQNVIGDAKIKNWTGKKAELHEFGYNGQEFSLTTGQLMNLYVLSKRPQAFNHLMAGTGQSETGGFTVDAKSVVKGQKVAERRVKVTETQMKEMLDKLTPEQKKMADAMQKFLAKNCSEWGNEVSMTLYGYKKFGEKTYWPIKTNENFNKTDDRNANNAGGDNTSLYAIRNQGMTKNLVKNANNPIVVGDIFDVFSEHVANMANYNAFVVPLTDAMKWFNYRSRTEEGAVSGSVKEEMERAFGKGSKNYFITFIKDVNGEVNKGTASEISDTFTSKYKAAAVGANVRTIVQQPTAYFRAASIMNPKYLAEGLSHKPDIKEMQENSAIAIWKSWGYFETGLGQSMKKVLTGEGTAIEKVVEMSMAGTGAADDLAWGYLWNAVKAEIKDKNKDIDTSSTEYLELVSKRFDEVVDQTQVVDTILHRSQIMRSQNGIVKMATAFMSEPTKSYNLLYNAVRNAKENNTPQNRADVARKVAVYAFTGIATAFTASFIDAFRDDDEEKEYWDKWMENFWANAKDNINPFNMIPYLKEIPSLWEGYDSSRMDMAGISSLVTSVQQAIKFAQGDSQKNLYGVTKGIIRALSQVTGIPLYNALRDTEALIEQFTFAPIDEKEKTGKNVRIRLLRAMKQNNEKQIKEYLKWYDEQYQEKIEEGKTDKEARSALKSSVTSQFKEIYQNSTNAEKIKIKQLLLKISVDGKQLYKDYDWSSWDKKKEE